MTQSGEMTIDNIPPSWVLLFKEAGASDEELKNTQLVIELMGIVADRLQGGANAATSGPNTPHRSSSDLGTETEVKEKPQEKITTESPKSSPPPLKTELESPKVPAPAIPPPPVASQSGGSLSSLDEELKAVKLHHAEPVKKENSFLDEIKQKPQLRHVDPDELDKMSKVDRDDLTSQLARQIEKHRLQMNMDRDGNEVNDNDDGYWD